MSVVAIRPPLLGQDAGRSVNSRCSKRRPECDLRCSARMRLKRELAYQRAPALMVLLVALSR